MEKQMQIKQSEIPHQVTPLYKFIQGVKAHDNAGALHLALFVVMYMHWISNGCVNPFNTSRKKLMQASRIRSTATYHTKISELKKWGIIRYVPSYHPLQGSTIYLIY